MLHQRGVATAQRARAHQRPPRSTAAASLPLALQLDLAQNGSVQPPDKQSVPPRTYLLSRARRVESPHLAIPQRLLQQLFPACPTPPSSSASYSASAVAMRFEVDGTMQPKQSQVELRVYNHGRQKAARVWGHGAYDLLKSKLLVGWRRESQGGLVAVLCSCLLPSSHALGQAQPASNPPHADPGAPGSHQQQQQQQQQQQRVHSDSAARIETPPSSLEAVGDCNNDLVVLLDDDTAGSPGQHGSTRCCDASSANSLPQTSVETASAGSPSSSLLAAAPSSLTPPTGALPPPLPTTPAHHALAAHPLSRLQLSSRLPGQPPRAPPAAPLQPLGSSTSLDQHLAAPIACHDADLHPASTAPASNRQLSQSSSTRLPDPIPLPALPPHQQPLASTASLTAFYTAMPMLRASMGTAMQGSEPMQSPPGCPPSPPRTYVPSRLHPINQEVYVAWGFWRDLFDGTQRPFPKQGLPLLVRLTGAVITSPQPVLLVRRITPFGYYVLRGIKGLSRLKGKLLVRWSLLVSGEVEVEVRDPCPLGSRPVSPGCASALATPTQWSAAAQQQHGMAQARGAPGGGWSSLARDCQPTSCNSLVQDATVQQTQGCGSSSSSSSSSSRGRLGTSGLSHLSSSQTGHAGAAHQGWLPVSSEAQDCQASTPASLAPPLPTPHSQAGLGPSGWAERLGLWQGSGGPAANNVLVAPEETKVPRHNA